MGIFINCLIIGPGALNAAYHGQTDFRLFYIGGRLAGTESLYNESRVLAVQQEVFGESNRQLMPVRLPFYYSFLAPLAHLPYRLALALWTTCSLLAIALFILLSPGESRVWLTIACCWSLPLIVSVAIGQDLGLVVLILAAALRAFAAQRRLLAGIILSLCLIKFHLFLLLPLLVLVKREWRLASGFSIGAAFLLMLSFAVAGDWPRSYLALISDPAVSPNSGRMPNLHGLAAALGSRVFVEFLLAAAVIALVWQVARRASFEVALAATLLGGLLLTRHVYLQDCAILIGSLVALLRNSANPLARHWAFFLLLPLPYVFVLVQRGSITAAMFLLSLIAIAQPFCGNCRFRSVWSQGSEPDK